MPSADSSVEISPAYAALSPFPWHATSLGTAEASRGKLSYRPCIDAGFIKHRPLVDGGLRCCVPLPRRYHTSYPFVSLAPHVRSTLPSDPTSR